jgi:hypothetical protein
MAFKTEQIEHLHGKKSHSRKWMKTQRNRKIIRVNKTELPDIKKYCGWEY